MDYDLKQALDHTFRFFETKASERAANIGSIDTTLHQIANSLDMICNTMLSYLDVTTSKTAHQVLVSDYERLQRELEDAKAEIAKLKGAP